MRASFRKTPARCKKTTVRGTRQAECRSRGAWGTPRRYATSLPPASLARTTWLRQVAKQIWQEAQSFCRSKIAGCRACAAPEEQMLDRESLPA
jgi:hypothetical protein